MNYLEFFSKKGEGFQPNLFINGIININNKQELATRFSNIDAPEIKVFQNENSKVKCAILKNVTVAPSGFSGRFILENQLLKAFVDVDEKVTSTNLESFFTNEKTDTFYLMNGMQSIASRCFERGKKIIGAFLSANNINQSAFDRGTSGEIYVDKSLETADNGNPLPALVTFMNNGGTIIYRDSTDANQTTSPTAPTISATTNIGGTYVELSVSQPTHVNALKYALVFVDGFFQNLRKYTSGSLFVGGLTPETSHDIKIIIADEYFNISPYSNTINVTTTAIDTVALFQNAVAYYKLDETSGDAIDVVNGYNGVDVGNITKDGEYYNYGTNASYVEIADNDDFSFVDNQGNNTDFVIKTEVIFDGFNSSNRAWLVSKRQSTSAGVQGWQLVYSNNELVFSIWDNTNNNSSTRISFTPTLGQKYILGVTFINNKLRLFIDGVRVTTEPIASGVTFANTSSVIKLGNETFGPDLNLVGRQKETVFIKGKGWTDGEISDDYNNGLGTTI